MPVLWVAKVHYNIGGDNIMKRTYTQSAEEVLRDLGVGPRA